MISSLTYSFWTYSLNSCTYSNRICCGPMTYKLHSTNQHSSFRDHLFKFRPFFCTFSFSRTERKRKRGKNVEMPHAHIAWSLKLTTALQDHLRPSSHISTAGGNFVRYYVNPNSACLSYTGSTGCTLCFQLAFLLQRLQLALINKNIRLLRTSLCGFQLSVMLWEEYAIFF